MGAIKMEELIGTWTTDLGEDSPKMYLKEFGDSSVAQTLMT